jgi:hypothetical protein
VSIPYRDDCHIRRVGVKRQQRILGFLIPNLRNRQWYAISASHYVSYHPTPTMKVHNNPLAFLPLFRRLSARRIHHPTGNFSIFIATGDLEIDRVRQEFRSREWGLALPSHFSILRSANLIYQPELTIEVYDRG